MQPREHVADVSLRIVGVHFDGIRRSTETLS